LRPETSVEDISPPFGQETPAPGHHRFNPDMWKDAGREWPQGPNEGAQERAKLDFALPKRSGAATSLWANVTKDGHDFASVFVPRVVRTWSMCALLEGKDPHHFAFNALRSRTGLVRPMKSVLFRDDRGGLSDRQNRRNCLCPKRELGNSPGTPSSRGSKESRLSWGRLALWRRTQ